MSRALTSSGSGEGRRDLEVLPCAKLWKSKCCGRLGASVASGHWYYVTALCISEFNHVPRFHLSYVSTFEISHMHLSPNLCLLSLLRYGLLSAAEHLHMHI